MAESLPLTVTTSGCCTPVIRSVMTGEDAAALSLALKALADPARLRLLSLIAAHRGAEACVCDLTDLVGLAQPTVSHHLKVLTQAGLVAKHRSGVWSYFSLVPGAVDSLVADLGRHVSEASTAPREPQPVRDLA